MTKKQICEKNPAFAYYSGFSGLEIHYIEYGIDDYVYFVAGAWGARSKQTFHRAKIRYTSSGNAYFLFHGYRVPLNECIRMGVSV